MVQKSGFNQLIGSVSQQDIPVDVTFFVSSEKMSTTAVDGNQESGDHQVIKLVNIPILYRVLYIQTVVIQDFFEPSRISVCVIAVMVEKVAKYTGYDHPLQVASASC